MPGIFVGIDGSDNAHRALEWAMREAAIRRAQLTVVTVHPEAVGTWGLRPIDYPADEDMRAQVERAAQEAVEAAKAKLGDIGDLPVTVQAVSGVPAEALIEAARDADMLVVGSRGIGGFTRLMMGSVSNQVVHHALCPVVIIPAEHRQ
jgi:nucleotide-binding universal stress UspA family protein